MMPRINGALALPPLAGAADDAAYSNHSAHRSAHLDPTGCRAGGRACVRVVPKPVDVFALIHEVRELRAPPRPRWRTLADSAARALEKDNEVPWISAVTRLIALRAQHRAQVHPPMAESHSPR
jgi:hypothetical protein